MDGQERRKEILRFLEENPLPISGTQLSKKLLVSRQVIVQDIALLRAENRNILSTNKGYILFVPEKDKGRARKTLYVRHEEKEIEDELYTIVDLGGKVLDVVVEHDIYGQITVDLIISNRRDADEFCRKIQQNKTRPLNHLTDGLHYHTIEADSRDILDDIEIALLSKGYLIKK